MSHFQEIFIRANLLKSEHLLHFDVVAFKARDFARLDPIPQKARLGGPALEHFANNSESFEASLFLNRDHVSKMLHEAHNVGVTRVLVLPIKKPLSKGFIVAHCVTLVHSDLDVVIHIR